MVARRFTIPYSKSLADREERFGGKIAAFENLLDELDDGGDPQFWEGIHVHGSVVTGKVIVEALEVER